MNKMPIPPKIPHRFFRWYCHPDYREDIEGDLLERFERNARGKGIKAANWRFFKDVMRLFRPGIIRPVKENIQLNYFGMLSNNLKTAFRIFKFEKFFTAINVIGLTVGIWCSILITLWVQYEFDFDRFHRKGDQLFRVWKNDILENKKVKTMPLTAYPIGDALVEEIPEILNRVRCSEVEPLVLSMQDRFVKQDVMATDPNFFQIFSFPLKEGNAESCLQDLSSIVISESLAKNHFNSESALGKIISIHEGPHSFDFKVTGVFYDIPENSSLQFDAILPVDNYLQFWTYPERWGNSWLFTYVILDKSADMQEINNKIKELPKRKGDADWFTLMLQPYADQYLYSRIENGQVSGGRIDYVVMFSLIAVFTLLIACFNFINLTTARSARRSREIGIRKVTGAHKGILIAQFLTESALLVFTSMITAILLTQISLPFFNEITAKTIAIDYFDTNFYLFLLLIAAITLLLSGIYPAVFLASFHAVSALKGKLKKSSARVLLRRGLVTFQFGLAVTLIAATLVVFLQLTYIQNKDLGLDKENIIYMPMDFKTAPHYQSIKSELLEHTSIHGVSASDGDFRSTLGTSSDPKWKNKDSSGKLKKNFAILDIDFGLLELLDIKIEQGRSFSSDFSTDSMHFVINEEAAEVMDLEHPVGEDLEFWGVRGKIVGVTKNFHFASLHERIAPIILRCKPTSSTLLYIKTKPGKTAQAISHLEKIHNKFSDVPFVYHFLDETLEQGYQGEMATQKLAGYFSLLAIVISCLGLLGLASYSAEQRTKELAIRKVMGAGAVNIIRLLLNEYFLLILIGFAIGLPVAYHWSNTWLNSFAYKVQLGWWIFAVPGVFVLSIALLTVGKLSLKTAQINPANSLKNE
ncbi:ABC transporter permease [Fulvivirgaceae bacterium BMA12]|uniref:ABC transporter permease n=1 Tax=Agaribacillus aureus TaxID=3051825 RepID=A0ABT8L240_9BACT|nr:ABC transporter permease [Fulvivirgaceae bacterium BMA12]